MASQEEKVQGEEQETTPVEDTAEFSGAWDDIDAKETGQPAPAVGRQDDQGTDGDQGGGEAGQGEAEAGQPNAGTTPGADAGQPASREELPDDVLANADPRLKAHLEHLEAERQKAQQVARSNGGRLAQALNELHALRAKGGDAGGKSDDTEKGRKERLDKVREDYPEVSEPILEELSALRAQVGQLTAGEVARAESRVVEALGAERDVLLERHPDLPTIVAAPEYKAWAEAQKQARPAIDRIIQDNTQAVVSAADAALVFDLFKAETGFGRAPELTPQQRAAAERRSEQLDAGRTATGETQPGVRSDARPNSGTFEQSWDEFEDKDQRKAASRRR